MLYSNHHKSSKVIIILKKGKIILGQNLLKKLRRIFMSMDKKPKHTKNNKKEDGKFQTKNVKHDPQGEAARAVFGLKQNGADNKSDDNNEKTIY